MTFGTISFAASAAFSSKPHLGHENTSFVLVPTFFLIGFNRVPQEGQNSIRTHRFRSPPITAGFLNLSSKHA